MTRCCEILRYFQFVLHIVQSLVRQSIVRSLQCHANSMRTVCVCFFVYVYSAEQNFRSIAIGVGVFVFGIPRTWSLLHISTCTTAHSLCAYFFYYPVFEFYIYVNWATDSAIESEVFNVFMVHCVANVIRLFVCLCVCVCLSVVWVSCVLKPYISRSCRLLLSPFILCSCYHRQLDILFMCF